MSDPFPTLGLSGLIIALWCWSWIPQMIDLIDVGRQAPTLGEAAVRSTLAASAYTWIVVAIAGLAAALVASAFVSGRPMYAGPAFLLLAPWVALNGLYAIRGGSNIETLLFPLVALAFVLNFHHLREMYSTLRLLIILTALSSITLGMINPAMFLTDPASRISNDKAIFGDLLLNGLFPTSNQLGITLAMGLPLVIMKGGRRTRWIGGFAVVVALVWAASRTSLAATLVVLAVMIITARSNSLKSRALVRRTIIVLAVLTVALPILASDPEAFSRRVFIWKVSLSQVVHGDLAFGLGTMIFREVSPLTVAIGAISGGHNVFVSTLTVGGIVGLACFAALFSAYLSRAFAMYRDDPYPLTFLLSVGSLAVLEDPFRAFIIAPSSFVLMPLLAMPLALAEHWGAAQAAGLREVVKPGKGARPNPSRRVDQSHFDSTSPQEEKRHGR